MRMFFGNGDKLCYLLVIVTLFSLMGCERKISEQQGGKVSITFSFWGEVERISAYEMIANKFEQKHPNISVNLLHVPTQRYASKVKTLITANMSPDLIQLPGSEYAYFLNKRQLLPLNHFIEEDQYDVKDFVPSLMDALKSDGKLYGLTPYFNFMVLYYNKDIFDKKGIPYPDESWTQETLFKVGKELTEDMDGDRRIDQYGVFIWEDFGGNFLNFIWQNGDELFDKNGICNLSSPEVKKALEYYKKLLDNKVCPPYGQIMESGISLFETGKVAMDYEGTWAIVAFRKKITTFKWDITLLPRGKKRASYMPINGFFIHKNTKYPRETWEFLKFMVSREAQIDFLPYAIGVPSRISVIREIKERDPLPPDNKEIYIKSMDFLRTSPLFPQWGEVEKYMLSELEKVWVGGKSLDTILPMLERNVNKTSSGN